MHLGRAVHVPILACTLVCCACCAAAANHSHPSDEAQTWDGADIQEAAAASYANSKSQNRLLAWGIEHSDPQKLRKAAAALQNETDPAKQQQRRQEIQALIEAMKQEPTEMELMKECIAVLAANSSADDQALALNHLGELVESIDNANDLKVLGGIKPVVNALNSASEEVKSKAAAVLGVAASNNAVFQQHALQESPHIIFNLLEMLSSNSNSTVNKAVYALGTFLRITATARRQFSEQGGLERLQKLLEWQLPQQLRNRVLTLVADLAKLEPVKLAPEFMQHLVDNLRLALPDDLSLMERMLHGAEALLTSPTRYGAKLLAADLGKALDNVQKALSSQERHALDGDEFQYRQELLQLAQSLQELLQQGAASHTGASEKAASGGQDDAPRTRVAQSGSAEQQPDDAPVPAVGPARDEL